MRELVVLIYFPKLKIIEFYVTTNAWLKTTVFSEPCHKKEISITRVKPMFTMN